MTGSTITAVGSVPQRASLDRDLLKASLKAELFGVVPEPMKVGRYALMKRIAVGGMGEVYAAYDEQLDRKVAIKLVRPDRLGPGGLDGQSGDTAGQRLIREAQTLARLSHPNVVQVYEAGVCGTRVFLAMEFIRGRSLRQWIEQRREIVEPDKWRAILSMFQAAGRGLQAAHAAGLVHRDFKPDNVLIGDDGRVCVADFGLARSVASDAQITSPMRMPLATPGIPMGSRPDASIDALDEQGGALAELRAREDLNELGAGRGEPQPLSSLPSLTQSGTMLGTPAYMSPEQMEGAPADWRSDQFAFCVALYESLYACLPFSASDLRSLHARMTSGAATPPPRRTDVPTWIWKVLERGLSVDPAMRYASMGELLASLAADPAQQRKRILGGAFLGGGALLALLVLWFLLPDRRAAVDPCAEAGAGVDGVWNPARAEQIQASFLATKAPYAAEAWMAANKHLERYAGELRAERKESCAATHVRREQTERIFELQTLCLDRRERHLDALATELGRADVKTVERGAENAASLPKMDRCRDREALIYGVQPPDDAATAARVARVQKQLATARAQRLSGRRTEALELVNVLLKTSEQADYPPLRAELLAELGTLQRDGATSAEIDQSEQTFFEAIDLAERYRDDELASSMWADLTLLARRNHADLKMANQWVRRAIASSWRINDGGRQRSYAISLSGGLHFREGRHEEALRLQREAVQLAEAGGASQIALANRLQTLANTLQRMKGHTDEAQKIYTRALAILDAELGKGHPRTADFLYDYGAFLAETAGDFDGARRALGNAIDIWTRIHGGDALDIGDTHVVLGKLEISAGHTAEAAKHASAADAIYRKTLTDPNSPKHAQVRALFGQVAFYRGDYRAALAAYEEALALAQLNTPKDPVRLATLQSNVGEMLVATGAHDRALAMFAESEKTLKTIEGGAPLPFYSALLLRGKGRAMLGKGNASGAVQMLEGALTAMQAQASYPLELADVQWALAQSLRRAGNTSATRAEELARNALRVYRELGVVPGEHNARTGDAIERWLSSSNKPT